MAESLKCLSTTGVQDPFTGQKCGCRCNVKVPITWFIGHSKRTRHLFNCYSISLAIDLSQKLIGAFGASDITQGKF